MKAKLRLQTIFSGVRSILTQRTGWVALAAAIVSTVLISCATMDRTLMLPPQIPGAKFVGSQACKECHEDTVRWFATAAHARLKAPGTNAFEVGCESCHGPGSLHAQSGGNAHTILNPGKSPETCFQCHLDKRGQFNLSYHHPVLEGKISCVSCHDPHKGDGMLAGGTELKSERDLCSECHIAQRGPHVFEHQALREGCTACHEVHGSVNQKLLSQRNANLCLKCHMQRQVSSSTIVIGGRDHTAFLSRGTCWSAGCHEAVHGSQVNKSLRF
jgi:predicted CXXCH cytochrome family protein